ncbi:cellulose binding domain-containing protein [Streptomonospora wellingtoniae]|uniref:Cellulose binding domain-containing protein n=1 Tax=Streptomonospora wellingtoniae TaxID=3075544 RepID=A0ABU2KXV6_9ACTN|nr:cellulose binding domain-containing protein [Streptomonospora sp. DSM 45055]MDT0304145.1 cellulose binding domain-containing protein [Streptomonospora sp. DSM 45055]
MSSDTHEVEPSLTRTARRRRERRKRRLLAAGALSAGLACSGLLIMGVALGGGDTGVDVAEPPPPSHEADVSPGPSQVPAADGGQQDSGEALAASATPAEPSPEQSGQSDGDEAAEALGGDEGGGSSGGAGTEGSNGGTAPQGTGGGGEDASGSGAEPGSGCAVGYSVANEWPGGFQAEVTVSADASIGGWRVAVDFPDGQTIDHAWNAEVSGGGGSYTVSDSGRNGELAAGESTGFGFIGRHEGDNRRPHVTCTPA